MLIFAMMTVTVSCSKNDNKSEKNIVPDKETAIENVDTNGNNIEFVAQGDYFYHNDNKKWNRVILKGVNMGLTLATTNLNNPDVSYETYMEWFEQISEMNANTVKVFTIMNPDFYQAFYGEDKDFEDIEIENCIQEDKDANRVYGCIVTLMEKIKEKLAELPEDADLGDEAETE